MENINLFPVKPEYQARERQDAGKALIGSARLCNKAQFFAMTLLCMILGISVSCSKKDNNNSNNRLPEFTVPLSEDAGTAVDLGLSVKWADKNLSGYYGWGIVEPLGSREDPSDYQKEHEYPGNGYRDVISASEYDAARMNWGGSWRMPTYDEFQELQDKCTFEYNDRSKKIIVTGPNGNTLVFGNNIDYYMYFDMYYTGTTMIAFDIHYDTTFKQFELGSSVTSGVHMIRPVCD